MSLTFKNNEAIKELAKTKKNVKNINNNEYAKKYINQGFVPFTCNLKTNEEDKKVLLNVPQFSTLNIDNCINSVNITHNCMALRMGTKIEDDYYVVLIDIDDKDEDNAQNGMIKWKDLTKNMKEFNTPTQKTGNNGLHYLFKVKEEKFKNLPNAKTKLYIDGEKFTIDFKGFNQFVIVEPTKYAGKSYKWIIDSSNEIEELPKWIYDILINKLDSKKVNKKIIKKNIIDESDISSNKIDEYCDSLQSNNVINETELKYDSNTIVKKKIFDSKNNSDINNSDKKIIDKNIEDDKKFSLDELEQYILLLDKKRADDYDDWIKIGFCLFNINKESLYIWKKFSKQSNKYDESICDQKWKTFKNNREGIKIEQGSLIFWLKKDNAEKFVETKRDIITQNILHKQRKKYTNSMCIEKIYRNADHNYISLKDTFCDFQKDHHDANDMYVELYRHKLDMKCHNHLCRGKIICEHIIIPTTEANVVFNVTQNNYYIGENKDSTDVKFENLEIFEDNKLNELICASLNGKAYDIALVFYFIYGNKIGYGDEKWYNFNNHKWHKFKTKNPIARNLISVKFVNYYKMVIDYYKSVPSEHSSAKIKKINNIIDSLKDTATKNNIITELSDICFEKNCNFVKNLDKNKYLLVFDNGVFDLKTFTFRDGKPEDNMSMSFGYDYIETYTDKFKDLMLFLSDIQPEKAELDYILTYLSIALVGNSHELFTILYGSSRNGKTKLAELIKLTFGEYYSSIEAQMLTRPKCDASSPNPTLLSLLKKKIVIASEPEKNCKLNSGFIKFITGRDSTELRECHQNEMVEFRANFVIFLLCNQIPEVDNMDNAFSKRLRSINFPSEFVDVPDVTKKYQKKIDIDLNDNFDFWKQDFMLLLIHYYKNYAKTKTLVPTKNILEWTNAYREEVDIYVSYTNDNTMESTKNIHTCTLYNDFVKWHKVNFINALVPSNREFVSNMRRLKTVKKIRIDDKILPGIENMSLKINEKRNLNIMSEKNETCEYEDID